MATSTKPKLGTIQGLLAGPLSSASLRADRPRAARSAALLASCLLCAASLLWGCSAEWYRRSADEEAVAIVTARQKSELGVDEPFRVRQAPLDVDAVARPGTIEDLKRTPPPQPIRSLGALPGLPSAAPKAPPAPEPPSGETRTEPGVETPPPKPPAKAGAEGEGAPARVSVQILSLQDALRVAFANNRSYQSRKESVYLSALSLTLARHNFAPILFGSAGGDLESGPDGRSGSLSSNFGLNLLLTSGARLSLNIANTLVKYFTGNRREVASTVLRGTLTQPLFRGFGTRIAREPLTQAERNVVYQVRELERARKELAVSTIAEYYRVLQTRDRVTNEYNNWQSLVTSRDRVEALADAERVPRYQVDQARQQEFQAQSNWIDAVANYEAALDRFKITLGIPTDTPIALDQSELEKLEREPVESMPIPVERAVEIALAERLDLRTARDQVEDAERKVAVARDALQMQLDLVASASAPSASEPGGAQLPLKFESEDLTYSFGFDLDLPIDRKAERNAYVSALISLDRSRREHSLQLDNVRLAVRDAYRRLEREIASYKIQKASVALAEQRVESTGYLLQAGRAQTRDLLESQSALLSARNSLTAALINYAIARQEFLLEIEALRVDESGRLGSVPLGGPSAHE